MTFFPQTPRFWYTQDRLQDRLTALALSPLGAACGWIARKRFDLHCPVPMEKPVLCVGNLTAGGAGKTPVALALCDIMKEAGYNPHFLTRGYGGTESGPLQVSPNRDTAADVGDEALLLVEKAPTWVARNRPLGAQIAFDTGADLVILDDGFQNPLFHKDFSLIVVDGADGFGNGRVVPAGPLRENIAFGLSRAHAVVILGQDLAGVENEVRRHAPQLPILKASIVPETSNLNLMNKPVFAFAGIGRPEKFKASLVAAGAKLEGWGSFPDHFPYLEEDLAELLAAAKIMNAIVVTTAKDHARLPSHLKSCIEVFRIRIAWDNAAEILPLIDAALRQRR